MRIQAYRNLHREEWSIRDPRTGLVIDHAAHVELEGVEFRVQPGGRAAVLRDGVRRVHAYVVGALVIATQRRLARRRRWVRFTYNPHREATFVVADPRDPRPIFGAERVRLDRDGAWCLNPRHTP